MPTGPRGLLLSSVPDGQDVHRHRHLVLAAAEYEAAHRTYIPIVPAPGHGDVFEVGNLVVGGVEVYPAELRAPRREPGVGFVGAHGLVFSRRRMGEQVAADVAGGQTKTAQAGDLQMGEILADAVSGLQNLHHWRG